MIEGISASPEAFVDRASASVVTAEGCTARESISPAADTVFVSFLLYPPRAALPPTQATTRESLFEMFSSVARSHSRELWPPVSLHS